MQASGLTKSAVSPHEKKKKGKIYYGNSFAPYEDPQKVMVVVWN